MDISEQYLNNCYDAFERECQKLMNDIKTGGEEAKTKHQYKELTTLRAVQTNILKFIGLRKKYEEKIKNL